MKRSIIFLLFFTCIMTTFTGCDFLHYGHNQPFESSLQLELESQLENGLEDVIITDIFGLYDMAYLELDGKMECFYRDEKYEYYMHPEKIDMLDVCYSNGAKLNLKEALDANAITLEDFDKHEIDYYRKPLFEIVDCAWQEYIECPEGKDVIYEDAEVEYYFDSIRSEYIEVTYSDGSKENIKNALASGKIDVVDMAREGIACFIRNKDLIDLEEKELVTIVDVTKTGGYPTDSAVEGVYQDDRYSYSFSSIKSYLVDVYYTDGTCEDVKTALEAGRITMKDVDFFDISYSRMARSFYIKDYSEDMNLAEGETEEIIFENEVYKCYFKTPKSQCLEVQYQKDGTFQNVIEALEDSTITLADLTEHGIGFYVLDKTLSKNAPKTVANIVDEAVEVTPATEVFYQDDAYQYYFHCGKSESVFVYYTDGTRESIRTALDGGRISIMDLDKYNIDYKQRKI